MTEIRYTLLTDGSSDSALIPIISWLLRQYFPETAIQAKWADLRGLSKPPQQLVDRIRYSLDLYPCDVLFIHRDAEREPYQARVTEIEAAIAEAAKAVQIPQYICVVPIRMQEAWLLFDEQALRRAAGNPNGKMRLELPAARSVENLPDPKNILHEALRTGSGLHGKRLERFNVRSSARRVADFIDDFSPLRVLSAFQRFEDEIRRFAESD